MKTSNPGFSLLEIMVVVAIIALLAAVAIPRIRKPRASEVFIKQLNALCELAYSQAVTSGKLQRIFFDFTKKTVTLESESGKNTAGEIVYKPAAIAHLKTTIEWPDEFQLQSFYINEKVDIGSVTTIYFIIMPHGLAQRVTINIFDQKNNNTFALVLNPFLVRFEVYDDAQKP